MEFAAFILVIFFSSILQGITGFGSALIAAPLLLLFTDQTTTVISLTFVSFVLNGFLFRTIRQAADRSLLRTLFLASLLGLPFGMYILHIVNIQILRIAAGSLAILFAGVLYSHIFHLKQAKWMNVLAGSIAGILHTSISMSGPPVVLLLLGQNREKEATRKTLAAFFFLMSLVSLVLFFMTDSLEKKGVIFGLYGIPAALLGGYLGEKASRLVSQKQFMRLSFLLVCATGIVAIYSGLKSVF